MNKSNRPVQTLGEISLRVHDLSHACIVRDLTPIATIDRRVRLPLSKWRGHGVGFCSWLESHSFSPLGETGEGF